MAQSFIGVPSIYPKLLELRKSKAASFKPNKYWREDMKLRYYQVVGALHMMLLDRMVLGDGTGLGKCVSEDSYLTSNRGLIRIGSLYKPDMQDDHFHPLPDNFKILGFEGSASADSLYVSGRKIGLTITTHHGYENTGLPNHPVMIWSPEGFKYVQMSELKIGDYACLNRKGLFSETPRKIYGPYPMDVDERLGELLGYYVSEEGSENILDRIQILLRDLFDKGYDENYGDIIQYLKPLCRSDSGTLIVPEVILQSPESIVRAFLKAFFNGSKGQDGMGCSSKSSELLRQIQVLLLMYGVRSHREKTTGDCWALRINIGDEALFVQRMTGLDCLLKEDFFFDKIEKIEEKESLFLDLHVPQTHNFTANGFINHNTAQSIAAYTWLLEQSPNLKLLIVCPKSALYQWAEEFNKFSQDITTRVIENEYGGLTGFKARKLQYQGFKENAMIMNYTTLLDEYEAIKESLCPQYMIIYDECVAFKGRKTKTHTACQFLAEGAQRVYGLSATIIKNGLEEVYGIYDVVVPGLFGKITKFKDTYCVQKMMKLRIHGKEMHIPKVVGYKNLAQFKQVLDPYFLIRRKEEVASELPKLISKKVMLDMLPEQRELYRQALAGILYEEKIKQEFAEIVDKIRNGASDPETMKVYELRKEKYELFLTPEGKKRGKLAALTYCQMISDGPSLVNQPGESSKEVEFMRLMTEELVNEKVILFTRFKGSITALKIHSDRNHIKYTEITGAITSAKERDESRIRFQTDPECNLIFITTAGAASLNMQAASVIIFYDTPWSYGDLAQTIGRAQRIGSLREHIVLIHFVNRATIDVRVINKVSGKKDLSDQILGDTAEGALEFTSHEDSEIDELFDDLLKDAHDL